VEGSSSSNQTNQAAPSQTARHIINEFLGEEQGEMKKGKTRGEDKSQDGKKDHKLLDKKNIDGRVDIMKIKNNRHDEK
jgi:hypothetical protein